MQWGEDSSKKTRGLPVKKKTLKILLRGGGTPGNNPLPPQKPGPPEGTDASKKKEKAFIRGFLQGEEGWVPKEVH